jgi:hypothetical protein
MELRQSRFTSFGPALMRSAVDVRCPFFDKRVMQFGAGMSPRFRSKDKLLQAGALARLAPQLASIPWLRTGLPANAAPVVYYGALGARFVTSRARRWAKTRLGLSLPGGSSDALIDHGRILREQPEVRRRVETLLAKPSPTCSGFFDAENVRRLLAHHCAGNTDHTEVIGRLLTVEVWHRMFQAA